MHWLALRWPRADGAGMPAAVAWPARDTLAWWALGFTPHVAWVDEALLLEVSACERLWGGRRALQRLVIEQNPAPAPIQQAPAATSLTALARLRWRAAQPPDAAPPARWPAAAELPLHTLSAARPHLGVLARLGCRTLGDVQALPRAGLARRFGPALGRALDIALGRAPDVQAWVVPPERFVQSLELPERADTAPALLWSARRLLQALQHWLAARQQGVLALELAWAFDQRRLDGRDLPREDRLVLRTAEAVQAMDHLQRLLAERLAHTPLLAPVRALRLRVLQTAPWQPASLSFLPEDQPRGEPLHVFVERVGARLGAASMRVPVLREDHRPECRQAWQAAEQALPRRRGAGQSPARAGGRAAAGPGPAAPPAPGFAPCASAPALPDALSPSWLLRPPLPLAVQGGRPCHRGQRLRLIAGPQRIEAGWWPDGPSSTAEDAPATDASPPAARDYFIAQGPTAELLWIYRERATSARHAGGAEAAARWFLHGLYA